MHRGLAFDENEPRDLRRGHHARSRPGADPLPEPRVFAVTVRSLRGERTALSRARRPIGTSAGGAGAGERGRARKQVDHEVSSFERVIVQDAAVR